MHAIIIVGRSEDESMLIAGASILSSLAGTCILADVTCGVAGFLGFRANADIRNDSDSFELVVKNLDLCFVIFLQDVSLTKTARRTVPMCRRPLLNIQS